MATSGRLASKSVGLHPFPGGPDLVRLRWIALSAAKGRKVTRSRDTHDRAIQTEQKVPTNESDDTTRQPQAGRGVARQAKASNPDPKLWCRWAGHPFPSSSLRA